jgi:hypothetical protein
VIRTKRTRKSGAAQGWFLWVAPFFLPAFFFQSSIFAFISPLPFFIITLKNRTWVSLLALFTNAAIVYAMEKNLALLSFPIWFWFSIGISFPLFIRQFRKVPVAFAFSFTLAVLFLFAGIAILAHGQGVGIVDYVRSELNLGVDKLMSIPEHPIKKWVQEQGKTELIRNLMLELPSGTLIAIILCYWFNLLLAFRTLPGFLSRAFWGSYRNPEWLVWPTLLCGALYIFEEHALYYVGMNGLKVLLMFYGFQGLSIVTYFLNRRQIFGLIRAVIYGFLIFLASPFAFALGFFDQWFDFRRKFGQS